MFGNCSSLAIIPNISKWNTSNVTNMSYMFYGCSKLKSLLIDKWNVSNVTDMSYMFCECSVKYLGNLSKWNLHKNLVAEGFYMENDIKSSFMKL